ncbi:peptide chain release factor N(5)-glutamine methyltransferase [Thiocystis violacea]|uniref:peptide chain release factor N(5)-glutamine methyltransferase n=1 Tax=Thiocystis violacea TaxID=13725 RepID=UPI001908FF6B|nr:peptide chain release factor N(5)-glutamine methyltransferase [Thiocystis violacea]MBK1721868.1 protein-(glutamine-N5) methyltransferase, release factor-specific [Thiocystis violacea]
MPDTAAPAQRRVGATLGEAAAALAQLDEASPRLEAELLLCQATGWPRTRLMAWPEQALSPPQAAAFDSLLQRRLSGEPIAYIRGHQSFWTLELRVSPATLIPRPETELLVETALDLLPTSDALRVADLGTGSGAIAAAIATERPGWQLIATDLSAAALTLARANFQALCPNSVVSVRTHWLTSLAADSLDAIVSNPPYIPAADGHLERGDLRFEPLDALSPGGDGLDAIRAILSDASRCLRQRGLIAVEHGFDQGAAVRQLFRERGLRAIETRRDLAGIERVTLARR